MKLSPAQRSAMLALDCAGDWMCAHVLRVRLDTLDSLVIRGFAQSQTGSLAYLKPRIGMRYKLTDAGRDWCKSNFTDVLTGMVNEAERHV